MTKLQRVSLAALLAVLTMGLQGCLATKIVTVPVKVAYGAGKLAVKGTAAAVRAVTPDKDKDENDQKSGDQQQPAQPQKSTP